MGTPFSLLRSLLPSNYHTYPTLDSDTGYDNREEIVAPEFSKVFGHSNPSPSTSVTRVPTLFALVIGINDYANARGLLGAVSDAKAMKAYLIESLGVPNDQIRMLLNVQATRSAIIQAFGDLQFDKRIKHGDPVVIFFAGHGGELPAPPTWSTERMIQCLLPYDYKDTNVIPDRTIGALIDNIAEAKGNNITVIFDCCYSAGCGRDENERYVPRTVELNFVIPDDLDRNIWRGRAGETPAGFAHHGLRSHVLLAACREKELAYERNGQGQFTSALLRILKGCVTDTSLTYAQVLERIRLDNQRPQCVGINQHRILFDVRALAGMQVLYPVKIRSEREYIVGAGLAHGVSHGVEFALYDEQKQVLGFSMPVVDTIQDFQTIVVTPEPLTHVLFAKLTRAGEVSLQLAPEENVLRDTLRRLAGSGANVPNFRLVEGGKEARLQVAMEGDRVVFTILDEQVKRFGLTKLPHTVTLDAIGHVLHAATHYFWYLHLVNTNIHRDTSRRIVVDFYRLQRPLDDIELSECEMPFLKPIKPGFFQTDPTHLIDFVVDPNALYGVEIKNNMQRDLYLNVFLFNNSSLSIVPCYIQSSAGDPEAPLKRNGTFTIGHGIFGTAPLGFSLAKGQDVDVAHLKIFFATRPIDLTDVVQMSPFSDVDARPMIDGRGRQGGMVREPLGDQDNWFTVVIPIVQRRG